jgi:hypothetical protein
VWYKRAWHERVCTVRWPEVGLVVVLAGPVLLALAVVSGITLVERHVPATSRARAVCEVVVSRRARVALASVVLAALALALALS